MNTENLSRDEELALFRRENDVAESDKDLIEYLAEVIRIHGFDTWDDRPERLATTLVTLFDIRERGET